MEVRWFYHDGQVPTGPFTWSKLQELLRSGFIGPQTFVWREGDPGWVTLSSLIPMPSPAAAMPPAPPPISAARSATNQRSSWTDSPPAPWRRYGARMLDTTIHGLIGFILLGFAWYVTAPISVQAFFDFIEKPEGLLVNFALSSFLAAFIGGLVIGGTGSSIGKAIFGIKVLNAGQETIGIAEGLSREFKIWVFGLGFAIPFVSLFTMSVAFKRLKENGVASWDKDRNVVLYRESGTLQKVLNVIGFCLVAMLMIAMKAMG